MRLRIASGCARALSCALLATCALAGEGSPALAKGPLVSENVPATANDLRNPRGQNSAQLAADPTNLRFVALANRLDGPDFSCALQLSGNGGRGWVPADPVPRLPPGAEKCYAPEIAFDRDGTLYYLFVGLRGRGNTPMGVFLTSSDDRGRSFTAPRRVLGPRNYQTRMALDPTVGDSGRIHLVWLHSLEPPATGGLAAPPNPILSAFSDDGGKSFSRPVQVNDPQRELSVAPAIAVGRDHSLHVLYYDLEADRIDYQGLEGPTWPGRWSLVSTTSAGDGGRFSRGVVVDDRLQPPERVLLIFTMPPPALAADRSGRLFAAWYDKRNGDWDVFLRRSQDGGRSWQAPVRLNDDRLGDGRHQYLPRLAVAPNGRLDAIFFDRRRDPQNILNDLSYTYSRDAGRSFAANVRVSSASSDTRSGQHYLVRSARGLTEFGGRVGLLSRDSDALAAWTDTRNSASSPAQDIFTAEVSPPRAGAGAAVRPGVPPGGSGGRWALILVSVLGLAPLGTLAVRKRQRRAVLPVRDAA